MACKERYITDDLKYMAESPGVWSFFHACRLLECSFDNYSRIGSSRTPEEECTKIYQLPELAFKGCDIEKYNVKENELFINCFGLFGTNGPMPLFLTEYIYRRYKHSGDRALLEFMNIFQNRLISLFYRAWALFEPTVSCDRDDDDYFKKMFNCIIGNNHNSFFEKILSDTSLIFFSGCLMKKIPGMKDLESTLECYFGLPAEIEPFTGSWTQLPEEYLYSLGIHGASGYLGKNITLGRSVWERKYSCRVKIGPMEFNKYIQLLPGTEGFKHLKAWIKKFIPENMESNIQLKLKASEVNSCRKNYRLGYTAWVYSENLSKDREDLNISDAV